MRSEGEGEHGEQTEMSTTFRNTLLMLLKRFNEVLKLIQHRASCSASNCLQHIRLLATLFLAVWLAGSEPESQSRRFALCANSVTARTGGLSYERVSSLDGHMGTA